MYCKKCGNPVDEADVWCSACGTRLKEEPSNGEEQSGAREPAASAEETKPVRHTEFNWNVHDFSTPKRPEELRMRWTLPQSELAAQAARRGEQTEIQALQPENQTVKQETAQKVLQASGIAPEKEAEAAAAREESVKANEKYFTFSKKNEDFQRLLDQEYEKLSSAAEGGSYTPPVMSAWHDEEEEELKRQDRAKAQNELERMIFEEAVSSPAAVETATSETTASAAAPVVSAATDISGSVSAEPVHVESVPSEPVHAEKEERKTEEPPVLELSRHNHEIVEEPHIAESEHEMNPIAQQLAELKKTTESFYQQLVREKEALQLAEKEAARRAGLEKELEQWQERNRKADAAGQKSDSLDTEIKVTVAVKSNGKTAFSETVAPESTSTETAAEQLSKPESRPEQSEPKSSLSDTIRITKDETLENPKSEETPENSEVEETAAAKLEPAPHIADEEWHANTLNNFFTPDQDEPNQARQEDKPKKSGAVGKVILAVIAILLAAEIVALGIRYFAPESGAALVVENAQMQLVEMVDNAVNYIKGITG